MLTAVHRWLTDNPLWVTFVIAPLFSAFLLYVAVALWNFFKVKPQQLNIWILKARISRGELRLKRFHRLLNDQSYLIVKCFQSLWLLLGSITLMLFIVLSSLLLVNSRLKPEELTNQSLLSFVLSPPPLRDVFVCSVIYNVAFLMAVMEYFGIINTIFHGDRRERTLKKSIERLKTKLLLRDSKRYQVPDSNA